MCIRDRDAGDVHRIGHSLKVLVDALFVGLVVVGGDEMCIRDRLIGFDDMLTSEFDASGYKCDGCVDESACSTGTKG